MTAQIISDTFRSAAQRDLETVFRLPVIQGAQSLYRLEASHGAHSQIVLLEGQHAVQAHALHELIRTGSPESQAHYLKEYDEAFFRQNSVIGLIFSNRLAGQAVIRIQDEQTAVLQALSVHPGLSGQHAADRLIACGLGHAQSKGCARLLARVKTDNEQGQRTFERNGFVRAAVDAKDEDPRQHAYIYVRALNPVNEIGRHASSQPNLALWRMP